MIVNPLLYYELRFSRYVASRSCSTSYCNYFKETIAKIARTIQAFPHYLHLKGNVPVFPLEIGKSDERQVLTKMYYSEDRMIEGIQAP